MALFVESVPGGEGQVDVLFPVGVFDETDSVSAEVLLGMWTDASASCSVALLS